MSDREFPSKPAACLSLIWLTTSTHTDDDLSLPKATVKKIVQEIVGPTSGISLDKHAYDLLIECSVEFVTMISSQANEIAEASEKKTIATEHIERALRDLGFAEYIGPVLVAAGEQKDALKGREKRINKIDHSGLSTEELIAMQQRLLQESAVKFQTDQAAAVVPETAGSGMEGVKDEEEGKDEVKEES
ncbi:MAG: hypothetical protein GOMPHAMPRED_003676 [Gomphillus americanus]|uniref:NCT transcriptional regulatory complex subunit B n=1 Tax=Gomphillus americanus TaxID=1940652 RepID=A0A8H3FP07_9LECA|nr:MAG: hypothetical protein GOMPHAMPRED_003676 [Gomphillus americanus]